MTTASQPETARLQPRLAISPHSDARLVVMSMNPRAGARARHGTVAAVRDALTSRGYDVRTATDLRDLNRLSIAAQKSGDLRAVVAVGGDGTASVVRNHVPLDVPLLPVPMGTENLLGRYLGQLPTPQAVCRTINEGVVISLDLGRAGGKNFLLMISAGFDAEVIRSLHENRRGNIRRTTYIGHTLRAIRHYTFPPMRLYLRTGDDSAPPRECRWLFGFNLPLYALGLPIAPEAIGTDGLFDVCTFERGAVWSVGRYLWHIARKAHLTLPDAAFSRTPCFHLEPTTEASIAYQIDGDYGGTLPVDVEVVVGQLKLLVPRETACRLGFKLN
jgi:diacylglycerol kinase family enzyme